MFYDDKNIFPLMKMWKWSKKIQKYFLLGLLHSTHLPSILASWQEGFHHYCHCPCEQVLLSIIPNHFLFVYLDKQNHNLVKFFPHNIFLIAPTIFTASSQCYHPHQCHQCNQRCHCHHHLSSLPLKCGLLREKEQWEENVGKPLGIIFKYSFKNIKNILCHLRRWHGENLGL